MPHNLAPNQPDPPLHLTPVQVCERLIGPPEVLGPAIGFGTKAAYHWRNSRDRRAAGDLPSADVMRRLLAYSDAHGLGLTPAHLIHGAPLAEVEDILASLGTLGVPAFASRRRPGRAPDAQAPHAQAAE